MKEKEKKNKPERKDSQHITIHIADVAPISLDIPRDKEALARQSADNVNLMWSQLGESFRDKTSKELLAMVAFRYAQVYYELVDSLKSQDEALDHAEKALDELLLNIDKIQ